MKRLSISPVNGGKIVFGKLPIFTSNLRKELGDEMHTRIEQLVIVGRYYAAEMKTDEKKEETPSPTEESVLAKLAKNGGYVQMTKAFEPTPVSDLDQVAEECKADVEEANEPVAPAPKPKTQPRTQYQVGRARFEQLKELERTGELAKCRNRWDICEKMGLEHTEKRRSPGYNWVSNQIRKGFLSEELIKYNKQNSGIYHYRLTGVEPSYSGNKNIKDKTAKKKAEKLTNELDQLGFINLSGNSTATPSQSDPRIWLKTYDYIIYKLFVYGNGQVSMDKAVSFDEVKDIFTWNSKKQAGRIANVALTHLIHKGVLAKAQPEVRNSDNIFSLTMVKGGQYARRIYSVVSSGSYENE